MSLDSQRLRSLIVLAEELHFGRAASRLRISQPSLSQQIARLEREVGVLLVDRGPRGTRLTPAGASLVEGARPLLAGLDRVVADVRAAEGLVGTLRVGVPRREYAGHPAIAAVVDAAREAAGAQGVEYLEMLTGEALAAIRSEAVDAAYVYAPVDDDTVEVYPAFTDAFMVALPGGHRLTALDRVGVEDLGGETIVTWSRSSMPDLRNMLDGVFGRAGFQPRVLEAPDTPGALTALVCGGAGVAFVAQSWAESVPETGMVFRALARPQFVISCVLVVPRERSGPGARALAAAAAG
jgi:DNA-binding transcriptional LysR family regulator